MLSRFIYSDPCCPKEECGEKFAPDDDVSTHKFCVHTICLFVYFLLPLFFSQQYFPDRFVRKDILNLLIGCKYSHMGCDWEGKFSDLQEHLTKACVHNSTKCEFCHQSFRYDELDSHKAECPMVSKECPLILIGCHPTPQEVIEHVEFNKYNHLADRISKLEAKLERPVPKITTEAAETNDQDVSFEFGSLVFSKAAMKNKVPAAHSPEGTLANFDANKQLKVKDEEIASLRSTISKLEKAVRSKTADFEDRDFRLSLIENSNHDGSMVWKIPQFSQRMDDAKSGKYTSIFSLPFYTGHYGYKMCLRLYILGDGNIGKGSYMSLFFVIMKGEFDNILQWPFTHKVTFKLINQNGGRDVADTFKPDPMSSSFQRPKSDMNIASGSPRFIAHSDLKNGFVVDDTIVIKCIVEDTMMFLRCLIDTSKIMPP